MKKRVYIVIGPTASGKTARSLDIAEAENGEVISVDSRQVYRMLDIGTEKISMDDMRGIPHHLINIRNPEEVYSAHDFVTDCRRLISEIHARGKVPVLAGGTHFYIDALLFGLPQAPAKNDALRERLEAYSADELYDMVLAKDKKRAETLDPKNKRRLVRALEILETKESVPPRVRSTEFFDTFDVYTEVINPDRETLRSRIDARLQETIARGLVSETARIRDYLTTIYRSKSLADKRLDEFGLEYKVTAQVLRGEVAEEELFSILSSKLWHLARRQKSWIRKLSTACTTRGC